MRGVGKLVVCAMFAVAAGCAQNDSYTPSVWFDEDDDDFEELTTAGRSKPFEVTREMRSAQLHLFANGNGTVSAVIKELPSGAPLSEVVTFHVDGSKSDQAPPVCLEPGRHTLELYVENFSGTADPTIYFSGSQDNCPALTASVEESSSATVRAILPEPFGSVSLPFWLLIVGVMGYFAYKAAPLVSPALARRRDAKEAESRRALMANLIEKVDDVIGSDVEVGLKKSKLRDLRASALEEYKKGKLTLELYENIEERTDSALSELRKP